MSGYEVVTKRTATDSVSPKFANAVCPAGKKPIGGGAAINNSGFDTSVYYTYPSGTGWYGGFKEDTATAGTGGARRT